MPVGEKEFKAALSRFASGVTVVTARWPDGRLHGITVSAFTSLSLNPPLVLICIEKRAHAHEVLHAVPFFAVHILRDSQGQISRHFSASLPEGELFKGIATTEGLGGAPLIPDVLATIECRRVAVHDGGDHTIFVGGVERVDVREGSPLLYYRSGYRSLASG